MEKRELGNKENYFTKERYILECPNMEGIIFSDFVNESLKRRYFGPFKRSESVLFDIDDDFEE